jgi:hypothetical protein
MDNCLKPFITYDWTEKGSETLGNSCWLDSLFVALFHNNTESIKRFVDDLQPKIYNNSVNVQLEKYNNEIIQLIKEQYNIINESSESYDTTNKKIIRCRIIRLILEEHRKLLRGKNLFNISDYDYNSFLEMNSVFELLIYLKNYVLDTNSFNNINIKQLLSLEEEFINNSKDIQIINMHYEISHFSILQPRIKENLNNYYLNSIIVHNGLHYMCYYKCNNNWYFYDDMGIKISSDYRNKNTRTIFIGDLTGVIYHHIEQITKLEYKGYLEIMLLYLKNNSQEEERVRQEQEDEILAQRISQQEMNQLQQKKEQRERQVQKETDELRKEIEREKQERARQVLKDNELATQLRKQEEEEARQERELLVQQETIKLRKEIERERERKQQEQEQVRQEQERARQEIDRQQLARQEQKERQKAEEEEERVRQEQVRLQQEQERVRQEIARLQEEEERQKAERVRQEQRKAEEEEIKAKLLNKTDIISLDKLNNLLYQYFNMTK